MTLEVANREDREDEELVLSRGRTRMWICGGLLLTLMGVMGARGAQLCLTPNEQTLVAADQQRWGSVRLTARRGAIFDRHGRRLAANVATPNIVVDPARVKPEEVDALAGEVASLLELDTDEVAAKMRRTNRYARLAVRVHPSVAARIEDLRHPALRAERSTRRYYPEQDLAAQVLGFVDGSGSGRSGIERYLDDQLKGGSLLQQRRRDRRGGAVDKLRRRDDHLGMDVHTTLDRSIQRMAERALADVIEQSDPVSATMVVMEVESGDVLAMANVPTFNPNSVGKDAAPRRNHAIQDAPEPGSVMKPFTIAAAIEEGLVDINSQMNCLGGKRYKIGRASIGDDHPHKWISVSEVLKYSSNIGTAQLALRLGSKRLLTYFDQFGFGHRTGIQLPSERGGKLRSADRIKPIELATTSYGQGMQATALQIASATATLANGGVRMRPRLVKRVEDLHGVPEYIQTPTVVGRVVSEDTAKQVAKALKTVTQRGGTGTKARVPGYAVAGKTGTAEKVVKGRYSDTARVGSFMGFVPADDPVLAIVVMVDEPRKGSRYGGSVAGPAFSSVAGEALRYLGVPPDPALMPKPKASVAVADVLDDVEDESIRFAWNGRAWTLPSLNGRSMRQVLRGVQGTGLSLELDGSGEVVGQSPPAGARVAPGETLKLTLR